MTQSDRETSLRLLLPHPSQWTVNEAEEARTCSGYCSVRYEGGMRVVVVPRSCSIHGEGREAKAKAEAGPMPVGTARYVVGCAGQFALHEDSGGLSSLHGSTNDEDEAFAMCDSGPVGCEVYDTVARRWIGPCCQEEIDEAKARFEARADA